MFENSKDMFETKSACDDKVFAQLTDLFGDTIPTEVILKTGQETKWKRKYLTRYKPLDKLIKL